MTKGSVLLRSFERVLDRKIWWVWRHFTPEVSLAVQQSTCRGGCLGWCDSRANNLLRPPELDGTIVKGGEYLIKSILTQDRLEFRLSHPSTPTFDPFC